MRFHQRLEMQIHRAVNRVRVTHGESRLEFTTELRAIARYHSRQMAGNDFFSHVSQSGETTADRYDKFNYDRSSVV